MRPASRQKPAFDQFDCDEEPRVRRNLVHPGLCPSPPRRLRQQQKPQSKATVKASTHDRYEGTVRLHINPHIGGVKLDKLSSMHVTRLYAQLQAAGKSARTRQLVHVVLNLALTSAAREQPPLIVANPMTAVKRPRFAQREIHPLTTDEGRELLDAAEGDRLEALYVLALTTGARQGELLALQWRDVDLDGGFITIRHTLYWPKGKDGHTLTTPKTKNGRRLIDLPEMAVAALHEHRKRMLAEGQAGAEFVFVTTAGTPFRKSNLIRQSFKPLLKAADADRASRGVHEPFPVIRFHDLRHTAATLMLQQAINPKVVQERLGHARVGITLEIYSHVLPTMQRAAADAINAALAVG